MRSDKSTSSTPNVRQKVMAVILVIVILVILWQIIGLFRGESKPEAITASSPTAMKSAPTGPEQSTPQPAQLIKAQPMTQRELQLLQLQQATEAKYVAALNELQMLKVSREIAETNQAIAAAKLATVTAEKNILNLLSVQVPQVSQGTYAKNLAGPMAPGTPAPTPAPTPITSQPQVSYSVISVTLLQYKWSAVLGAQGNLYNVSVGDILPPDGSKVTSISKSGVILQKDGVSRRISLVPII